MAANKMQFQYEVTANTSQARKALADLDKALDRLNKQQKMDMGLSQELTEAADAARLLQRELNAAMDVKTGKLNVSELARGLAQAGTSVEQLSTKFLNAGTMGEAAFRGLAQSIVAADVPMKRMNKTLSDAMTTLKNTVKWEISSTLVHGLEGAFSGAVSYAKNLNTSLTNIRIVTNQSIDDMVKFTKQANAAAKELSTTTKAYADASLIYYQQGDNQELAAKKAAITIKASNASFETSAKEMSEYLTAVWNSYQVGAEELERYVDIMASLGAKTATSLEEIATSMQKVAATANTVGVSMEQVSSIIATVSSVTRESAESIGTSYKTIFARIGDLKLGKADEDGVGLGQVSSQLDAIGVKILDETGNLREMGDIIMDLGTKWQTMNQAQKTAVAQVVAGKRQYTQLMALFENWDMFQSNMNIAENSEGALQDMADIYAESWEAASNRVKASIEGIYNQIINDQAIIKFTNGLAGTLDIVGDLVEGLGGIEGVVTLVGSTMALTFKNKIAGSVNEAVNSVSNFVKSFKGMSGMDIVKSLFGSSTGLREYQQQINQLQSQLKIIVGGGAGMDAAQATNLQKIIELKKELLNQEKLLSTSERERIQSSINSLMNQVGSIEELNQSYADQNRYVNQLSASLVSLTAQQEAYQRATNQQTTTQEVGQRMQSNIDQYFRKGKTKQNYEDQDVRTMFSMDEIPLTSKKINLQDLIKQFERLNIAAEGATSASSGLQNLLQTVVKLDNATKQTKAIEMLENLKNVYSKKGLSTSWVDELINKLKNGNLNNINDTIREVDQSLTKFANTAGNKVTSTMRFLEGALGLNHDRLDELRQAAGLSTEQLRRLAQAYRDLDKNVDNTNTKLKQNTRKFGEVFADIVSGATSAMFSFSAMSSTVENWDTSSLTQKITGIGSLLTDFGRDIARGDIGAVIGDIVGAGLGAIFGAIEKKTKAAKEQVDSINKSILESAAELDKTSKAADQAIDNYEEASKQYEAGNLSQNDYLQIIDSVLGALDAEHLKVLALKGDYDGLRKAIEGANQERLAGDVAKAENLINTGYYNLAKSLDAYSGRNADKVNGRNGISLDWNNTNTEEAMAFLGFQNYAHVINQFDRDNWSWEGNQADLIQLQSNWEELQTNDKYKTFRESEDFAILTEYMKQFDTVFAAMDSWARTSASKELSELDITSLTPENAYDKILNTVLTSFNTSAEQATPYQMKMAQDIAKNWVANLSTGIQTGFYEGLNQEKTTEDTQTKFKEYAQKQNIQVAQDAILPSYFLTQDDAGTFQNGMDPRIYNQIQQIQKYRGLHNATVQNGIGSLSGVIASLGITEENAGDIGIHLADGQTISEYLSSASDQALNIILGNVQGHIDMALGTMTWDLETIGADTGWTMDNWQEMYTNTIEWIDKSWQKSINNHMNQLNSNALKDLDLIMGSEGISNSLAESIKNNSEEYMRIWNQLAFDKNGFITSESWKNISTDIFVQQNQELFDAMHEAQTTDMFNFTDFFEFLKFLQDQKSQLLNDPAIVELQHPEKSNKDFDTIKRLGADHTKWDDAEYDAFSKGAQKYGIYTDLWYTKTEGQKSQDVYSVAQQSFNEKYKIIPDKELDSAGYATYLKELAELREFATQATEGAMEDLENNFSNVESILGTLMSLDLSKDIDETIVSAEQFSKIMGISIKDFNSQYSTASQKQLALLQAQEKHSKQYANNLAVQANTWLEAVGGQEALLGDANLMQTWAILSQQVSAAQADAAQSAQAVNSAYATLNDEAVAGIASQWERANKEAEKQQQIAQILSSSIDNGIISNEEAAIVGMTADEWARYSVEARAALAAKQTHKANSAIIQTLSNEKKALEDTISYFEQHKQAFNRYIQDDDEFERALNRWNLSGEQIKTFREARTQAINNVGKDNADEILTEMSVILNIDKKDLESQIKQTAASGQDTISNIYNSLSSQLQSQAQEAVEAWRQAFDSIAEARKILLEGGSLVDMLGDPEEFRRVYEQYKKSNPDISVEDFKNGVIRGEITIEDIPMPEITDDYMKQIYKAQGLDGLESSRTQDRWRQEQELRKAGITKDAEIEQALATRYTDMFEKTTNLDSETIAEKVALIIAGGPGALAAYKELYDAVEEQKAILKGSEEIEYEGHEREETAIAVQEAADTGNLIINANGAIQVDGETISSDTIGLTREDGKSSSFKEYTKLQEAIARAQEAKYNDKTWDSLEQTDKDLLLAYGIDFNNVDTAATDCASALAACAKAAYELAMQAAQKEGYQYDEKTGTYTKSEVDENGQIIDGTAYAVTPESDKTVAALESAREFMEDSQRAILDTDYQTIERMASSVGLTSDELTNFAATLANVNEGVEDFNSLSQDTQKNWLRIAAAALKAQEGWDSLTKSQKDNLKILKKGEEGTAEYIKALSSITSDIKKIFNGSTKVTENFVKDHLDLVEKMSKGDREAAEELERFLLEDILPDDLENRVITVEVDGETAQSQLTSLLNSFGDQFADKAAGFVVTPEIDTTGASAALMDLMYEGANTAEAITNALNAIGWEPIIEYKEYPLSDQEKTNGYAETPVYSMINGTATITGTKTIPLSAQMIQDGFVRVPVIGSGKGFQKIGGGASGAKKPSSSGGGGGGGGSKNKEKKNYKRYQDETDRYHKNNETLSRLSEELDKINKLKDRAYGKKHLQQLEAETNALTDQLHAQQALYDEAMKYAASDQINVAKYGAVFDADGTITNYEQVIKNIVDEYNRAVDTYNNSAQEEGDKKALEQAEQRFADAKKAIEDYEEAIATANEAANEMLEIQNKISEVETEKITYILEYKVEMNERDLAKLEYYQDKYADDLEHQGDVYAAIYGSMLEYESNLAAISEAMAELDRKRRDGLINDEDYAETLAELYDQIYDNLGNLNELQDELVDTYANTLSLAREEVEKTTDTIDSANSALQSYIDILALMGNETDYKKMATFYEMMNQNHLTKIKNQRELLNALLEKEDEFQEKIRSGQQLTDIEKEQYQKLQEQIQDTRDALLSSTQEALETIRATYENTINGIAKDLDNFMAGAAGSMAHLQEQYGYFQTEQERYVSTARELYEVSKLNRDIEGTLGETTSKAAKEALKALQEKINKQSELNELTEYDIEMNQLQYQLLLARIKLEETQNAKDVVRLTRDENGNYAYRYTANQDKIDEAAQNIEDTLYRINELTDQEFTRLNDRWIENQVNVQQKLQEIALDYTLTEEEKNQRAAEILAEYEREARYIQERMSAATANMTENQKAYAEHYGVAISEITASTAGNVNESILSMIERTDEFIAKIRESVFGDNGMSDSWLQFAGAIGDVEETADLAYENMLESAEEMGEMNNWSSEQAQKVITTLTDTLKPLDALTQAWNSHNAMLQQTISEYENLGNVIQSTLTAIGEIPNEGITVPTGAHPVYSSEMAGLDEIITIFDQAIGITDVPTQMETMQEFISQIQHAANANYSSTVNDQMLETMASYIAALSNNLMNSYIPSPPGITTPINSYERALEQIVNITADFPNATDHNEIEEAILSLINRSAQFASQKK